MRLEIPLAVLTLIVGVVTGRLLGLSQFPSVALGLVPALLLTFRAAREWTGQKLTFKQWSLAIAIGGASTLLIYLAIGMR